MADGSARALSGVLYALLNPAQDRVRAPLDMAAEFSERLGITLPRLGDYLAEEAYCAHLPARRGDA